MDTPRVAGNLPSGSNRESNSFAESLHKENPAGPMPELHSASARSFVAGDLASGFSYLVPDFIPALGEDMLDAIALGEGATEEMQRYEEKTTYR